MATAVGASPVVRELRLTFTDGAGEEAVIQIPLDGAIVNGDIVLIVDEYVALSNAVLTEAVVLDKLAVTGYSTAGKPSASAMPIVAAFLAMEFQKVNPINAGKTVTRQVILPAYLAALRNDAVKPHVPVTGNATLNDLTDLLAENLDFLAGDGAHYFGGWSFNSGSKFGTKATVTDGF